MNRLLNKFDPFPANLRTRKTFTGSKNHTCKTLPYIHFLFILLLVSLLSFKNNTDLVVYCADEEFPPAFIHRMDYFVYRSPYRPFIEQNRLINRVLNTHIRRANEAYVAALRAAFEAHRVNFRPSLEITVREAYYRFKSSFTMRFYESLRVEAWKQEINKSQHSIHFKPVLRLMQRKILERRVALHRVNFDSVLQKIPRKALEHQVAVHKVKFDPVLRQLVEKVPQIPASIETETLNEESWETELRDLTNNPEQMDLYIPSSEFLEVIQPYLG